jgi:hypothetical protein
VSRGRSDADYAGALGRTVSGIPAAFPELSAAQHNSDVGALAGQYHLCCPMWNAYLPDFDVLGGHVLRAKVRCGRRPALAARRGRDGAPRTGMEVAVGVDFAMAPVVAPAMP